MKRLSVYFFFILILIGCGGGSDHSGDSHSLSPTGSTSSYHSSSDSASSLGRLYSQNAAGIQVGLKTSPAISLPKEHVSLTVGIKERLTLDNRKAVTWSCNNPNITIENDGTIYSTADKLGAASQAVVTATPLDGTPAIKTNVTIVNWRANLSSLTIEETAVSPSLGELVGKVDDTLYFSAGTNLYATNGALSQAKRIGDFPKTNANPLFVSTAYGHYLRTDHQLFTTPDYIQYQKVKVYEDGIQPYKATDHMSLRHAFAYDPDFEYIYTGEYSVDRQTPHAVYRGKIAPTGISNWEKILVFYPHNADTTGSVAHVHVTTVDPYTGTLWVGTGDSDAHSRLYYSTDQGDTFHLFAIGAQHFRILSMWFTEDYIYWNTDSDYVTQVVSRIQRSKQTNNKVLTPRLESGTTKPGLSYYVYNSDAGYFPVTNGKIYKETKSRTLNSSNVVYAIDDPQYNYREIVAKLENGSHWYHTWVKDDNGEDLIIMSSAAEGKRRDDRARLFGLKERKDGSVDVQELFSTNAFNVSSPSAQYVQMTPGFQDDDGFIYLRGRETEHYIYKAKLHWTDQ